MDEPIVIPKFSLTPEDIAAARAKKGILAAVLITVLTMLTMAGVLVLMGIGRGFAGIVAVVAAPFTFFSIRLETGVKQLRKPGFEVLYLEREVVVAPEGMTQTLAGGLTTHVPWLFITKVEDQERFFLLHFTPGQYFAIPRRILSPELDRQLLLFFHTKGLLKAKTR